jgi:hypothetical protein
VKILQPKLGESVNVRACIGTFVLVLDFEKKKKMVEARTLFHYLFFLKKDEFGYEVSVYACMMYVMMVLEEAPRQKLSTS